MWRGILLYRIHCIDGLGEKCASIASCGARYAKLSPLLRPQSMTLAPTVTHIFSYEPQTPLTDALCVAMNPALTAKGTGQAASPRRAEKNSFSRTVPQQSCPSAQCAQRHVVVVWRTDYKVTTWVRHQSTLYIRWAFKFVCLQIIIRMKVSVFTSKRQTESCHGQNAQAATVRMSDVYFVFASPICYYALVHSNMSASSGDR